MDCFVSGKGVRGESEGGKSGSGELDSGRPDAEQLELRSGNAGNGAVAVRHAIPEFRYRNLNETGQKYQKKINASHL